MNRNQASHSLRTVLHKLTRRLQRSRAEATTRRNRRHNWSSQSLESRLLLTNVPPIADAGGPYTGYVGASLTLDASDSYDPNASTGDSIVSYEWDLDGDSIYDDLSLSTPTAVVPWSTLSGLGLGIGSSSIGVRTTDTFGANATSTTTLSIYSTITVINTSDSGSGSLRDALTLANSTPGPNRIAFDIVGAGPHTISPLSGLPNIDEQIFIDGWSEPDFAGTPVVEINGANAGSGVSGLSLIAGSDGSTVRGLVINRFGADGIWVASAANTIQGNYIGTDINGTADLGNDRSGITVTAGATGNLIGGNTAATRNVISGNTSFGIEISGPSTADNIVSGNLIGTDVTGTQPIGNGSIGIHISSAQSNTIGGLLPGAGNVIAATTGSENGLQFSGINATGNVVQGNLIGTDITGTVALGSAAGGVEFYGGAWGNLVGGSTPAARNLISGNIGAGVGIYAGSHDNVIAGNYIGTEITGSSPLGNTWVGVRIQDAPDNLIGGQSAGERNVISGNGSAGIFISGATATGNVMTANYIGVNASGTAAVGNIADGVTISGAASLNRIGTDGDGVADTEERNIISGNLANGVRIRDAGTNNNTVAGNYIGTDVSGEIPLGNGTADVPNSFGVVVAGAAVGNVIGTNGDGNGDNVEGNVISANVYDGIKLFSGPTGTVIAGNLIGTNKTGTVAIGNQRSGIFIQEAGGNLVGTNADGVSDALERNIISGNSVNGIGLTGVATTANVIAGNFIGTDVTGTVAIGNSSSGIVISSQASHNLIGTDGDGVHDTAERNVISGNSSRGVYITSVGTNHNVVAGNYIGIDVTGTLDLGNFSHGVHVAGGADDTVIGTDGSNDAFNENERNVISGNNIWAAVNVSSNGTDRTIIAGNYIGTNAAGTAAIPNSGHSISVNGADDTRIGTDGNGIADAAERNVISGNANSLLVAGVGTERTVIAGNYIGTNAAGDAAIPNPNGIEVRLGATDTRIGTDSSNDAFDVNERNVISGNSFNGIRVQTPNWNGQMPAGGAKTAGTIIAGNYIGVNAAGTAALPNQSGINVSQHSGSVRIGTNGDGVADEIERNVISGNQYFGVVADGWTLMNLRTVDHFIAGDITATTITAPVDEVDLSDISGGNNGDWLANNPIPGGGGDYYAVQATGQLTVTSPGDYTFAVSSDNGSRLKVAGQSVVTYDVGGQGFTTRYGTISLAAGSHNFELVGFEQAGGAAFEVSVAVGAGVTGPVSSANGWRVLGDISPHPEIAMSGTATVKAYYPGPEAMPITIAGNYIGTDVNGSAANGNGSDGIRIQNRASGIIVGGDSAALRNVISGNGGHGIQLYGADTSGNVVQGNHIGTSADGTAAVGNSFQGVRIQFASDNVVGGASSSVANVISGNLSSGLSIIGASATANRIEGNTIGMRPDRTTPLPNAGEAGVLVIDAVSNTIGGGLPGSGNLISGNTGSGVWVRGASANSNKIQGNLIGSDFSGTNAIGNDVDGIRISAGAHGNVVGSDGDSSNDTNERNLVVANQQHGVHIFDNGTTNNTVAGNLIGVDVSGTAALGNTFSGIRIEGGATANIVGGSQLADRNVISGNATYGIELRDNGTDDTIIVNNFIGTDITGSMALGNGQSGILLWGTDGTRIGTNGDGSNDENEGNLISGNSGAGVALSAAADTTISGNLIGTNVAGSLALGNSTGIDVRDGSSNTIIGGPRGAAGNVVSGNTGFGIVIGIGGAITTTLQSNRIGSNGTGTAVVGNGGPGLLIDGATGTMVGGSTTDTGNIVVGNLGGGIIVSGSGTTATTLRGNRIGTNLSGNLALGNEAFGIAVSDTNDTSIGGSAGTDTNVIAFNQGPGLWLTDAAAASSTVLQNSFFGNQGLGIDLGATGQTLNDPGDSDGFLNIPIVTAATVDNGQLTIEGFLDAGRSIELYRNAPQEGQTLGQGSDWLVTLTEGSGSDLEPTTGTYGPEVDGITVSTGAITTNRFRFVIPLPAGVDHGTQLTAVALGSISEFSTVVLAGEQASELAPEITLNTATATIPAGGSLQVAGSFYDPDSTTWTATVDYGDGSGRQPLALSPTNTFSLSHPYAESGTYTATVRITDNSLATAAATVAVTVENEAPAVTFNEFSITSPVAEGQLVTLVGEFQDAGGDHTVRIEWGDGAHVDVNVSPGSRTFSATHTYLDDSNAAGSATAADVYRVVVTVMDDGGASDSTPLGLFLEEVNNVRPSSLAVNFNSTTLTEGDSLELSGLFSDPGVLDVHTVRVDWGDGTQSLVELPVGDRSFGGIPDLSHEYPNDRPTGADTFDVTVELWDDDEPLQPLRFTQTITVDNQIPRNVTATITPDDIVEGGSVVLAGSFSDAGAQDAHLVRVVWGDGTPDTVIPLAAGVTTFSGLSHTYLDNAPGGGDWPVQILVTDYDTPQTPGMGTADVTVRNANPILSGVTLSSSGNDILEGDSVTVTGSYSDIGALDRHTVTIVWGDGSSSSATVDSATETFTAQHRYVDNPPAGQQFEITATVLDSDGGTDSAVLYQGVQNVSPIIFIVPAEDNFDPNLITMDAVVIDPGVLDAVQFSWTAFPLVSSPPASQTATTQSFTVNRTGYTGALWRIQLEATDGDGGVSFYETTLLAGTNGDDELTIDPSTVSAAGTKDLLILGMGGDDVIDASAVDDPTVRLSIDGGEGLDFLYGGEGDDTFYLQKGDDAANLDAAANSKLPTGRKRALPAGAPSAARTKGRDRYVLTPNSTLSISDPDGDNILDFSRSDFGDSSGIRYDLSLVGSTDWSVQDVYGGSDATEQNTHFVETLGNFTRVAGSEFDDQLTGASNATIEGAGGNDQFTVKAGTTGAVFNGGADDDVLTVSATGITDLSFGGGADDDVLINTGSIGGLTFGGGSDDDILQNLAGGSISSLNFGGDDGVDTLSNTGDIGSLTFGGGADDDVLQNGTSGTITTLDFGGDDGIDALQNLGTITTLTFGGGADDDILTNQGSINSLDFNGGADDDVLQNDGTVVGSLNFGGDDGIDTLTNTGDIGSLTFGGGADDDVLVNTTSGTVNSLNFGGDDGIDTLSNTGDIGSLTFGGGADDDILVNQSGGTITTLNFGGDDGVDSLQNEGSVTTLTFGGGADDDVLVNNGSINALDFTGGADDDVLTNNGTVVTSLVFGGDDGVDTLQNAGSIADLNFTGGADDDVLINQTGGDITSLTFAGDDGVDGLQNNGAVTTLTFGGGADDDLLINNGSINTLDFTGGADDDTLTNNGTVLVSLTFGGDDGVDTLRNSGAAADLVFTGGADDDILINSGTLADIIFTGGADDDVLVNFGGTVGDITFNGDDGVDILQNSGSVDSIIFNGGADDDTLLNQSGAVVDTLHFGGDDGADALRNDAAVTTLTFNGGADDDLLINNGSNVTSLTFDGGADDDILLNSGSNIASLVFTGGADDDVLQNNGSSVGSLNFGGDDGLDVLINDGDAIGTLTFGGGSDDDVLVNNGDGIGVISFEGDLGNDTLIVRGSGTGSSTSMITFNGGGGLDAFQNDAEGFASITFNGNADSDVLKNNASGISQLTFNGGADDDVLENNGDAVSTLIFNGDDGSDILINDGASVIGLTFTGGADDDVLINNGSALSGLNFGGDDGVDTLVNTGIGVSGIIFTGGADDDVLINSGAGVSDIDFSGDAGRDRLWIQKSAVRTSQITFTGGADDDLLINDAGGVADLTFDGGADDDGLQNNGEGALRLTFNGGADDDVLVNTGSSVSDLVFNGDEGNDALRQSGLNAGSVTFLGGADDDLLIQTGSVQTLTFGGGADDDTLQNDGINVATLNFGGDDGSDVLINNGVVSTLHFDGGADDDTLQNNAAVVSLNFTGGADDDVLVNNADNTSTLVFNGDDGTDTLINNGSNIGSLEFDGGADGDTFRTHGLRIGNVEFRGGAGGDAFHYNAVAASGSTITFAAGDGPDFLAWRGAADALLFDGGAGDDLAVILGSGTLQLGGGTGDDTFQFQSHPEAQVTIDEVYTGVGDISSDTLDFSAWSGGALNIDLRNTSVQQQSSLFSLTLTDGLGVENLIGSEFGDTLLGNSRDNVLNGAEYSTGFSGRVASARTDTQWVLLDFDSATDPGEHIYNTPERAEIAARIAEVYRGPDAGAPWFDVRVVLDAGEIPAGTPFATLYFNQTPESGRPGGLASEIDPGNVNLDGSAVIQVNGLLGGVITAQDVDAEEYLEEKASPSPISDDQIGATKPAATSENFVLLSSKIAAHELGHLMGLRHADSFGPIGFGLHDPPGGSGYKPVYTGPVGGVETFDHLLGSPASVGSTRFNDLQNLFFGEREAVKLAFATSDPADTTTVETAGVHQTAASAQNLDLVTLAVPNTLRSGLNETKDFFVQLQAVTGQIAIDATTGVSESDWYRFAGAAGELVNIDVLSNSIARFGQQVDDYVDTIVRVWHDVAGTLTLVPYYGGVAENDDIFEPTDSSIIDLVLPQDGTYYIEVDTFSRGPGDESYSAAVALRDELHARSTDSDPTNDLSSAETVVLDRLTDTIDDTDVGQYHLTIFRFDKASSSDGVDTIRGYGGTDQVDGGPGDSYALEFDPGSASALDEGAELNRVVTIDDRAATSWAGSTIDYGDGSGTQPLTVDSDGTFRLQHRWMDNGSFTVTVTIVDDIGQSLTRTLDVSVANLAPSPSIQDISPTRLEGTSIHFTGTATDPAGANDTLTYTWDFGDGSATAAGPATQHTYADNGTYVVTLTVSDEDGGTASTTQTITVSNAAPEPVIESISATRVEGTDVLFVGSATDAGGTNDVLSYEWDFGDGSPAVAGPSATHSYGDNGTWVVTLTVSDEDGGVSQTTQSIVIANVAPVPSIDAISATRLEGTGIQFSGSATDAAASNDTLSYVWDFGDGSATAQGDSVSHSFGDEGTYTVTLTVSDEDGGSSSTTQLISVENVAPSVTVDAATVEVNRTGFGQNTGTYADPGNDAVTLTASLGDITHADGVWSWSYDAGDVQEETLEVTISANDGDGGTTTSQFTLIVNLPPALEVVARTSTVRGQDTTFTFTTTDPNDADQNGIFTYEINWGDGSPTETIAGPAVLTVKHVYDTITPESAPHVVSATVTDGRGLSSSTITHEVAVVRWEVQPDPLHPGETVLMIGGSTGSDMLRVREGSCSDYIRLTINERDNDVRIRDTTGELVDRIAVYGQDGDDYIFVSMNVSVPSLLHGGDGDDFIVGGYTSSVLIGGAGDDKLFGSYQRGILIGGTGRDKLFGWNGSDLLIGGSTAFDNDRAAIDALMSEWTSERTFEERRENLLGIGTGARNNGNYFLRFNQTDPTLNTVFDDNEEDMMWGGQDIDWFLANTDGDDDSKKDKLFGVRWYEVVDDLDRT